MVLGSDAAAACDDSSTSSYSSNWKLASITLIVQSNPEIDGFDNCIRNLFQASKGFLAARTIYAFVAKSTTMERCLKSLILWFFNSQENVVNLHYYLCFWICFKVWLGISKLVSHLSEPCK